jgi:DNA polymerase-3 subunit gamma/tau
MVLLRMLAFAPAGRGSASTTASTDAAPVATPAAQVLGAAQALTPPQRAAPARSPAGREVPVGAPAAAGAAMQAVARSPEPPPWLDDPPLEGEPAPQAGTAALRAAAAPAIAVATVAPAPARLVPTALGQRWAELVARLVQTGAVGALARELAWQAGLVQIDADTEPPTWRLQVERDSLRTDALRDKVCQALQAELGEALQLRLENAVPEDSPARRDAAERERRQRLAEAAIRSDPLVLDLMSQVKSARIVPGSIKPL